MSRNTYLIFSIIAMLASTFYNYSFMGSSSGSRSYNGSRVGGGYSSGWHKCATAPAATAYLIYTAARPNCCATKAT